METNYLTTQIVVSGQNGCLTLAKRVSGGQKVFSWLSADNFDVGRKQSPILFG
jgi:hypothetical protein